MLVCWRRFHKTWRVSQDEKVLKNTFVLEIAIVIVSKKRKQIPKEGNSSRA